MWPQNVRHAARRCSTAPCPTAPRALATLATRCERGAAPAAFEQHQPRSAARGSSIRQQELVKSTKGYTVQTAEPILDELISRPLCRRGQRRRTPASSSSSSLRVEPILFAAIQFSEEHHILAKCRVALRRGVMPHDHACSGRLGIRRALACAADLSGAGAQIKALHPRAYTSCGVGRERPSCEWRTGGRPPSLSWRSYTASS